MQERETILVTGAGGFIGGRVVEVLWGVGGVEVRGALRRWSTAARIGRLPVDLVLCDLTDPAQVDAAMQGVTAVVHCAVGGREATVDGTRNVLEAALHHGVRRVVHLSTIDVYGDQAGVVTEDCPLQVTGRTYGDTKIEAERICMEYADRGVPVVVLRPTIVYGPFSELWTVEFAQRLQSGSWLLSEEDCGGTCNLVYVDDLVAAILLALREEAAVGQAFNINGPDRPTWHEYFAALNEAMGLPPLVAATRARSRLSANLMMPVRTTAKIALKHFSGPIMSLYQRYGVVKRLMRRAEGMIRQTPTTGEFRLYGKIVSFPTTRAEQVLGYRPAFGMEEGVALSLAWLAHHGYIAAPPEPAGATVHA